MTHANKRYIDYARYNIWANNRIIQCLLDQDEKLLSQEIIGSFPNINATISHIWFAEMGWLSRLSEKGWDTTDVQNFAGTSQELYQKWQKTSQDFLNFVEFSDLEKEIAFEHKGQTFLIPSREIAQTVFNHGSYHRGQVVMMLRQLGVSDILQTDYIEWVREMARRKLSS